MITPDQAKTMPPMQRMGVIRQIEAILTKDKKNFDAIMSAAAIHYTEKQFTQTFNYLQKALTLRKKDLTILRWLAVVTAEMKDYRSSKIYSRKVCELEPSNADNWNIRGRSLDASGDAAGALKAFEKVIKIRGEDTETLFMIASCHYYSGDHEAAKQVYKRTLEISPLHSMTLYGYSTIHKFDVDDCDDFVKTVEEALEENTRDDLYQRTCLYYAAAKALNDCGHNDRAFAYYKSANDLNLAPSPKGMYYQFENNQLAFDKTNLQPSVDEKSDNTYPIFIVGMPRSGTTLIESLCAGHSKITAGDELTFLDTISIELGGNHSDPQVFTNNLKNLDKAKQKLLVQRYFDECRPVVGNAQYFTDKMPHNFLHVGLIHQLFPTAKIIHSCRHPIDTCISLYTNAMAPAHMMYKSDLARMGEYYCRYYELMNHWHDVFPGKIHNVYYEDVVSNTELNARQIIDHIGLNWEDGVMDRGNSQKSVKTLSAWQVRQPIYKSSAGKWRKFESHLEPLITALGDVVVKYAEDLDSLSKADIT